MLMKKIVGTIPEQENFIVVALAAAAVLGILGRTSGSMAAAKTEIQETGKNVIKGTIRGNLF